MGNHLAATAEVNVSDISAELELISPLNGNGQNCFATFHCWRHVREEPNKVQREVFQSISPHVLQMHTHTFLQDQHTSSNNNKIILKENDECTSNCEFNAENTFADKKKAYVQQLLTFRRKIEQRRLLEISKCTKTLLLTDWCACTNQQKCQKYIDAPTSYYQSMSNEKKLPNSHSTSSSSSSSSSEELLLECNQENEHGKEIYASRDEIICRLFLASQTRRVGVVTKVFVYATNNSTESLRRVKTLHETMKAMQREMEQVNAAHSRYTCDSNNYYIRHNKGNIGKVEVNPQHNLFYSKMDSTDSRFALLERPYIAYSLTERLATRPYWTRHERRFMCFQLLHAVAQLHEVYHTVHGDIKANNVLVQSSGWLYLTDAAPFKPAIMPADNPALFDYFYNTDEAHVCCCAPEKFAPLSSSLLFEEYVKHTYQQPQEEQKEELLESCCERELQCEQHEQEQGKNTEKCTSNSKNEETSNEHVNSAISTHSTKAPHINVKSHESNENINYYYHSCAMDVFSAGCVMAYILTGSHLLRLSDVLELRDAALARERVKRLRNTLAEHHLSSSEIDLLMEMLDPSSQNRPSASVLLSRYTNSVFPAYFSVLHTSILSHLLLCSSADEQLLLLHSSLSSMIGACVASTYHETKKHNVKNDGISDNIVDAINTVKTKAVAGRVTITSTKIINANKLQDNALLSEIDSAKKKNEKETTEISHILQLLLPFLFHALRHARSAEAVYRGLLCLQVWHDQCSLSTQINVILPELFYMINARKEFDDHSRIVALRIVCTIALTICKSVERVLWQGKQCECTSANKDDKECEQCHTFPTWHNKRDLHSSTHCSHSCGSNNKLNQEETEVCTEHVEFDDQVDDQISMKNVRASLLLFDHFYIPCIAELIDNMASESSEIVLVELAIQLPRLLLLARYSLVELQNIEQRKICSDNTMTNYTCEHYEHHNINNGNNNNSYTWTNNITTNQSYDVRRDNLLSVGWDMLHLLYRHPSDAVCTALLQRSLQIASFLGNERTAQDLVPLYTTLIVRSTRVQKMLYFHAITLHLYLTHAQFETMRFFVEEGLRQGNVSCQCATVHALTMVISANAHQSRHLFATEDMMLLIHSILPLLLSANDLLRVAACKVIEAATQSYSSTVIKEYLSWAVRPFLLRAIPLEHLAYLSPEALRPELREVVNHGSHTLSDTKETCTELQVERQHLLELLTTCANTLQGYPSVQQECKVNAPTCSWTDRPELYCAHCCYCQINSSENTNACLIQRSKKHKELQEEEEESKEVKYENVTDTNASKEVSANNVSEIISNYNGGNDNIKDYRREELCTNQAQYTLLPQWNQRERARALLACNTWISSATTNISELVQVTHQGNKCAKDKMQEIHLHNPLSSRAQYSPQHRLRPPNTYEHVCCAFQPSATPLHIRAAHMGAIYALCVVAPGCVLSIGACHEGLLWHLKSHELHNVLRLRLPEEYDEENNSWHGSSKDAFTCAQTLEKSNLSCANTTYTRNASSIVALGCTSGFVYLWDAERNEYVNKISVNTDVQSITNRDECDNNVSDAHIPQKRNKFNVNATVTSLALQSPQVLLCTTSLGQLHAIDTRVKSINHNQCFEHTPHQWSSTLRTSVGVPSCCLPLYYHEEEDSVSSDRSSTSYGVVVGTTGGMACLYDLRFQRCVKEYHLPSYAESAEWTLHNSNVLGLGTDALVHDNTYLPANQAATTTTASTWSVSNTFARPAITALVLENAACTHTYTWCEKDEVQAGPVCLLAASDGVVYRLHLQSNNITRKLLTRESCLYYQNNSEHNNYTQQTQCTKLNHRAVIHSMISVSCANEQRLLTAGADKYIRSWSLSQPSHSHYLYKPPYASCAFNSKLLDDLPKTQFTNNYEHVDIQTNMDHECGVGPREQKLQTIYELTAPQSYTINTVDSCTHVSFSTQSNLSLQMPTHHADEIMTLAIAQDADSSEPLLLSAARDGSLVTWANQSV